MLEDDGSILRADGQRGNMREAGGIGGRNALGARQGWDFGGERVARIDLRIENRAALNSAERTPGTVGERVAGGEAVLLRIGVEDQSCRVMLLGENGFDATIAAAIAGDDDFSFDADAETGELAVI